MVTTFNPHDEEETASEQTESNIYTNHRTVLYHKRCETVLFVSDLSQKNWRRTKEEVQMVS